MLRIVLVFLAVSLTAGPALADPNCLMRGGAGLRIEFGFGVGDLSEQDKMDFLVLEARRQGINADTAEMTWLECIKITRRVRGSWVTEYYDRNWNQVQ